MASFTILELWKFRHIAECVVFQTLCQVCCQTMLDSCTAIKSETHCGDLLSPFPLILCVKTEKMGLPCISPNVDDAHITIYSVDLKQGDCPPEKPESLSWCHNSIKISAIIFAASQFSNSEYKRTICHSKYERCLKYSRFGNTVIIQRGCSVGADFL